MDRREFIKTLTVVAAVEVTCRTKAFGAKANKRTQAQEPAIPRRVLGKTGVKVSALILGGVVAMKKAPTAKFHPAELANAALDAGINYFDTAPGYGRVKLARGKTGVSRDLSLWPETIQSLESNPKSGKLVFYSSGDKPLIRTIYHINKDGSSKYSNINLVTSRFSKLMKKAGIRAPKGTGFYTLRRTAATVAARSGDPFAVQRLLGHANLKNGYKICAGCFFTN